MGALAIAALVLAGCEIVDLSPSQDATVSCAPSETATWQMSGAEIDSVLVRCDGNQDSQRVVTCYQGVSSARVGDPTKVLVSCVKPTTVTAVTTGFHHSCALRADGTARCWGSNEFGQLGDGHDTTFSLTPVAVLGVADATAVSGGGEFTCAVVGEGGVTCWGDNSYRQLGNSDVDFSGTPMPVAGITDAVAIETGYSHACALLGGGGITCWGYNDKGQLGGGSATFDPLPPVAVVGVNDATALALTLSSTCALRSGGAVSCWGGNVTGQLGNGTTTASTAPVSVVGISDAVDLAAGVAHTCAALAGGTVKCWGRNSYWQLGTAAVTYSATPLSVAGLTGVVSVAAGSSHSCAQLPLGALKCWGSGGTVGKLGNGAYGNSATPVGVVGIAVATAIDASASHSCALAVGGAVRCWGYNGSGQLGDGTVATSNAPTTAVGL